MKYKISDIAKLLGVTTNTIRRYEHDGFFKSERDNSNYRRYDEFDISKAAIIRLYIKCGFSHNEIKNMIDNNTVNIIDLCTNKLTEMDKQIERMKFLRHWLKDNIKMIETVNEMNDSYIIMECLNLKYIIYSKGDKLFNENERLSIIKYFMYSVPEVQLFQLFRMSDVYNGSIIPYSGWAMKNTDIERFNLDKSYFENKYIQTYPNKKSIYSIIKTPSDKADDADYYRNVRKKCFQNMLQYIYKINHKPDGDIMEIIVNALGDVKTSLICIPIALNF